MYLLGLWQVHKLELTRVHPDGMQESEKVKALCVVGENVASAAQVITVKHGLISLNYIF